MIRLEGVSKHYSKKSEVIRALEDVSLEIPRGALALVSGPSGSGKTTLINVMAGLTRPTHGTVVVAGQRVDRLSATQCARLRRRSLAIVFQLFHLVPYLDALENVLLPTIADVRSAGNESRERAVALLEELGLSHRLHHYPGELSVGERQRCALARALLREPEVVLADEPTGNLDALSAEKVMRTLAACHAKGATVVLSSHQPHAAIPPDLEITLSEGKRV